MHLTLAQVARLFSVPENRVSHWIRQDNLPVRETKLSFEFDRQELLDWAVARQVPLSPELLAELNEGPAMRLADALQRGGVGNQVSGNDRYEVFRNAISGLPSNLGLDHELLLDAFIAREKSGGTAVGGGIAIPHPRYPVVYPGCASILRVCYLARSLSFEIAGNQPIDTLFMMICPTVYEHQQMLSRLTRIIQTEAFRDLLSTRPNQPTLMAVIRTAEERHSTPSEVS